jgi:hypothetical protein
MFELPENEIPLQRMLAEAQADADAAAADERDHSMEV